MSIIGFFIPKKIKKFLIDIYIEYQTYKTLSVKYDHWKTVRSKTPILKGKPIPWYTYSALEFISQFDFSNKIIFEYGSGNSSLFWAERCKEIVSIEDNNEWYNHVISQKMLNQEVLLIEETNNYINSISNQNIRPDVVIIDGSHRLECTKAVAQFVSENCIIIIDNSDWHPISCKYLRDQDYTQIDFSGFGPIVHFTTTTSIFFKNALNLISNKDSQPSVSIGGVKNLCDIPDQNNEKCK